MVFGERTAYARGRVHRRLPGPSRGGRHAGAIIGERRTAQAKKVALEANGVRVGASPTEAARLAAEAFAALK